MSEIAAEVGSVSIYTTPSIHERVGDFSHFDDSRIQWVLQEHSESKPEFLARIEERTEVIDFLIAFPFYGHILDYTAYARFDPHCEYLLFSFDLNGMIGRNPALTTKVYNYIKYPLKKIILRRIDRLLVEYAPIAEYVGSERPSIDVNSFTPVLYSNSGDSYALTGREHQGSPTNITITTPGMIDSTRRDYHELIDALDKLPRGQLEKVELVLLGKPIGKYGSTVIKRTESLKDDGMGLEYYTDWIPTDTFERKLRATDFLVSPLRTQRTIDGFTEQYGTTKGSGAISDAISYGTPLMLPSWFDVPERAEPAIHTYKNRTDLSTILTGLLQDEMLRQEWFESALRAAERYTKPRQSDYLRQIICET
ncbi:glycosyltransferase family protein [Salinarchaeum chitinilyticum]